MLRSGLAEPGPVSKHVHPLMQRILAAAAERKPSHADLDRGWSRSLIPLIMPGKYSGRTSRSGRNSGFLKPTVAK
jgi:hypothetical protein